MRVAIVVGHLPSRRELAGGPLDAEGLIDDRARIDPVVFADYQSDGTDLLEAAGIPVHISPKRTTLVADGRYQTAEELQARLLMDLHREQAFDAIIHDSARAVPWSWHEPRLGELPRGVILGSGPTRDVRMVTADSGMFITHGRRLWASTGPLASADFLLSDVDPAEYGLTGLHLPPAYRLNELPTPSPPPSGAGFVAVVALSEGPTSLADLVVRARAAVPHTDSTVFGVIHPDIPSQRETTRAMVLGSLPERIRNQVILAEPSSDGVAHGWLSQADAVVAARSSDLAVPAVAEVAAKVGSVVLSPAVAPPPLLPDTPPDRVARTTPRLVPMDGDVAGLIDELEDAGSVILYAPEAADLANRVWRLPGVSAAGLVLVCDAGPYLGEADPSRPAFTILGFRMTSWPSIRRFLAHTDTLHELIEAVTALSHAGRTDLMALPARGVSHGLLGSHQTALPAWVTDDGMLPPPNLAGISERGAGSASIRSPGSAGVREWAETHGFRDRIRLALPWKWGLLNRAMKNRW